MTRAFARTVFRAYRYAKDYPGLAGKDLAPGETVQDLIRKRPEEPSSRAQDGFAMSAP
jgi:hypothetical protein